MSNSEGLWIFNGKVVEKAPGKSKTTGKEYVIYSILVGKAVFDFYATEDFPCALMADVRCSCDISLANGKTNFTLKSLM